jgi:hypothetical protein
MGPSTASLGDVQNAQLIVASKAEMEDGMSDNQRGSLVTGPLPPAGRAG